MKPLLLLAILPLIVGAAIASEIRMLVDKSERNLSVFKGETKTHTFRIGLGGSPVGDKEKSGDGKTPEGVFYISVKNPNSRFYLSMGISYPDVDDAARGLREGIITKAEHDKIVAAQKRRTTPPWNTRLGGEIFIHGRGSSSDWTLGCIALDDADMKILYDLIEVGTKIEIKP
jgi:murein L,D-transpeptidase YafK